MNIPHEAVQAAAWAIHRHDWVSGLCSTRSPNEHQIEEAKLALEAAASILCAAVWEASADAKIEYDRAYRQCFAYGDDLPEPPANPYTTQA